MPTNLTDAEIAKAEAGYDRVSKLFGKLTDEFYQKFFTQLASGKLSVASTEITEEDIKGFLTMCGGVRSDVGFVPRIARGSTQRNFSHDIPITTALAKDVNALGSVDISIGIGIKF